MVNAVISACLRTPVLALVVVAVLLLWGWQSLIENPKDAIPDISENQTIVFTEWVGRSPKDVDEQVTYPLMVALQGIPDVREVRATSGFGWSIVYVVFQDRVDFYWARSRVLERLTVARRKLPPGTSPELGPDATALGQIFWYTVDNGWYSPAHPGLRFDEDGRLTARTRQRLLESDPRLAVRLDETEVGRCPLSGGPLRFSRLGLDELRSIQDFDIALALESVDGISDVASVGGFVRQYQIDVNPEALRAFDVSLNELAAAVRSSNIDVGAKVVEETGMEILIRGLGFLGGGERGSGSRAEREQAAIRDIENIVVKAVEGTPIYVRQLARVSSGPDFRRGALDKMGAEAVGGCLIMRYGENPLQVIERIKHKIADLEIGLPPGVRIVAFYDRSELIHETMGTLKRALSAELLITIVVVSIFLLHVRSSLIVAVVLPLAVLFSFICMQVFGIPSNIMSLAGIAVAIGTMVDMAIVMTENIYQHLSREQGRYLQAVTGDDGTPRLVVNRRQYAGCILRAATEVGPAVATAIATTVISFLPVFFLEGQAAKLFTPLAWTKTFCMVGAGILALTVVPPLAALLLRGRLRTLPENPIERAIRRVYEPTLRWTLRRKRLFALVCLLLVACGLVIWLGWSAVLRFLLSPLALIPGGPLNWSLAWWVHLGVGIVLGMVLLPLLLQTIRVFDERGRDHRPQAAPRWWLTRLLGLGLALAIAVGLQQSRFADRHAPALNAMFGGSASPSAHPFLAELLNRDTGIGQEFMPPLDEGDFLYMPSVLPAGSLSTVREVMRKQDIRFSGIPEVEQVVGKLGRIDSPLDPAPVGMIETVIQLKAREQWPEIEDPRHPTRRRRRTMDEVWEQIQAAGRFPGVLPSVQLQPIRTRVEMLSSGLNAKIGLKIYGGSQQDCEHLAVEIEQLLRQHLRGAEAVAAVRTSGKPYLEFHIDREAIARHGVNIRDVQEIIEVAVGGINLTTTYEGLDRYPVRVRYQRELRDDIEDLHRILVPTPSGAQLPLTQLARFERVVGPMSIRREGAKFVTYVTMNNSGVDESTLVSRGKSIIAQAVIDGTLDIPAGYHLLWTGSYERNERAKKRLMFLIPAVLAINFVLIYLHFGRAVLSVVVFAAIPVAFAGGFLCLNYWPEVQDLLYLVGLMDRPFQGQDLYLTVAVWVGFIALFGIAVDDGIVVGTYLNQSFRREPVARYEDIEERVVEAGLRRIRPCLMTTVTTIVALIPILLSTGRGSDLMIPMALPVFGGMIAVVISLLVVPTSFCALKQLQWRLGLADPDFRRTVP